MIYSVYIITNRHRGVLYIGSTNGLKRRTNQHKRKVHSKAFSERYNLDKLVYYENHITKEAALKRERQLKKWNREWKIRLIEEMNPEWKDLSENIESHKK